MADHTHITMHGNTSPRSGTRYAERQRGRELHHRQRRYFDKQTNEFKDKEAIFWRCSAWQESPRRARPSTRAARSSQSLNSSRGHSRRRKVRSAPSPRPHRSDRTDCDGCRTVPEVSGQQQGGDSAASSFSRAIRGNQQQAQQSSGWGQNPGAGRER